MNPYTILGVPSHASQDQIKKSYRKIAKKFHPDLNPGNKEAAAKFSKLNTANEILSDPIKRAKFDNGEIDENGAAKYQQPNEASNSWNNQTQHDGNRYTSAFEGIDPDLFQEFFGKRSFKRPKEKVEDENYKMDISFVDAAIGADREITLPYGKKIKIKIPAGIESGKKLRFKGGATSQGAAAGDIFIEINILPSKLFVRNGYNIEMEIPITLYEAVLGGEVKIPTLEKPVVVKIPAGSNTGTKLRLKGKGIVASNRGDIVVTLKIMLPKTIDPELEKMVKEWGDKNNYNPRVNLE